MTDTNAQTPKRKIVFVVEDDLLLVKAYQAKLQKEGVELWLATDGKEAVGYLEKDPPNVVLLDLMLPGVNGYDVLAAMRKHERWKHVPVLILTNLSQPLDIEKGKHLGVEEYLIKSNMRISDIVIKLKKYL